jgi:cellulose biosynthesis protein BcsQ
VIVLVNRKGGVTKTTSAANLGAMISHAYRRLTRLLLEEVRR